MLAVLDHLSIQCADFARSAAFYDSVLEPLGCRRVMDFTTPVGEVIGYGDSRPRFWIGPQTTGTVNREVHIAFQAESRARW